MSTCIQAQQADVFAAPAAPIKTYYGTVAVLGLHSSALIGCNKAVVAGLTTSQSIPELVGVGPETQLLAAAPVFLRGNGCCRGPFELYPCPVEGSPSSIPEIPGSRMEVDVPGTSPCVPRSRQALGG